MAMYQHTTIHPQQLALNHIPRRFCNNELADWKLHLTPEDLKPEVSKVQPIMVVYFEGQIHRIPVKQGPDGLTEFTGKIRCVFDAWQRHCCCMLLCADCCCPCAAAAAVVLIACCRLLC